ncbi:CLUMA_CG020580, isoform A [Clunio marinus]|uniref:CLUMA_CG020580, isoform A n=1 Tax=Clunio marinus TaxID=568069 RepID=A0A1J1J5E9_9DIPT|nr:CLUMA_CG020580, isoform A [Clunio marinus]
MNNIRSYIIGHEILKRTLSSVSGNVKIVEQKVRVGGYDINYVGSSIDSGITNKTIVCLPGALGSAFTDFKPQIENLPKLLPNFNIIAWDPPGYGKSIPPSRQFPLNFLEKDADMLKDLMEVLKIPNYNILGWSDGGITAMIFAAKYPSKVEKLAIFGSNAYLIADEIKMFESIRDISKWSAKMRDPLEKLYGAEYFKTNWEKWIDTFKEIYEKNNGDICKKFVNQIKAETLILHGEKDPMVAKEHIPYLLTNIPGSKIVTWPEGKHNIHLRYAVEFNEKVAEFFKK